MHKCSKQSAIEIGLVQRGKIATGGWPVLVHGAFAIGKKMAGNGIEHMHVTAFFYIFIYKNFLADAQPFRQALYGGILHIYHQVAAAVATNGAVNLWLNLIVQAVYHAVNLLAVL